jgi:hypothetical protein
MLRLPVVLILALTFVAVAERASAQYTAPLVRPVATAPSNPEALYAWCRSQVFHRFGHVRSGAARTLELDINQAFRLADACVRSKGASLAGTPIRHREPPKQAARRRPASNTAQRKSP